MKAIIKTILIISVMMAMLPLSSCEETYGKIERVSWRIVSNSDMQSVNVTVNKSVADITCGRSGGTVILECSGAGMRMYNETPVENEEYDYDEYSQATSYRNGWCDVKTEDARFIIVLKDYESSGESHVTLEIGGVNSVGHLNIHRIP